jgi:toxin ParE1/3/4
MNGRHQVVLTPRAFADLTHIRDYLIARSQTGADNVRQAINTTLDHLADHPGLGRDRPELGVRSVGVPRYSYTVYYRVAVDQIEIVHVRDDRRKPLEPGDL